MDEQQPVAEFYKEYDLIDARRHPDPRHPAPHQSSSLQKLDAWYRDTPKPHAGGLLVLPTGGGKTFTAVRFLTRGPLSDGYKVLWIAHTHHLLEQAFQCVGTSLGYVAEPKPKLNVRVVSGTKGHLPVRSIKDTDDMIIGTVQTLQRAFKDEHPCLEKFLSDAGDKLFVVFDEAHHAPAPTYRKFVMALRKRCRDLMALGLTATPKYADERRQGWLKEIFPQEILFEVSPSELMAANILARPVMEEPRTSIEARFDEREYQKWVGTNRDLPEEVITKLAENRERNSFIADTYVANRAKYGRTLIFADRWYQCDFLREYLLKRDVKADVVYSHVDADPDGAEARNRRAKDENAKVIERFKQGDLDVLINVRMLTEGTDVPEVQSVFLTRQTTSGILMTQMVGRALRGSKFGGTDSAYIVAFIDSWRQLINWATYDQLAEGGLDDGVTEYGKRPPLQLISIELVRKLARKMDSGSNVETEPFLTHLPVGWYRVEYMARDEDSDDIEHKQRLVMVFENEEKSYEEFIERLMAEPLDDLDDESLTLDEASERIVNWRDQCFRELGEHLATNLDDDLFCIVRHIAQNGSAPKLFRFDERRLHDLDGLAIGSIEQNMSAVAVDDMLRHEYNRSDRFWGTLYHPYRLFKSQFDACVNRILEAKQHGASPESYRPKADTPELLPAREPSDDVKRQVRKRDKACLCCDEERSRRLQVDHIHPWHLGGANVLDNLQTLCATCNNLKGTQAINFRDPQTDLTAPGALPRIQAPRGKSAGNADEWHMYVCRCVNFFYRCGAVQGVTIGGRGASFYNWVVELGVGNNPEWLRPQLPELLRTIIESKERAGLGAPKTLTVRAPDVPDVVVTREQAESHFSCGEVVDEVEETIREKAKRFDIRTHVDDELLDDPEFKVLGLLEDKVRMVPALARLLAEYEFSDAEVGEIVKLLERRFPGLDKEAWPALRRRLVERVGEGE